MLKNFIAAFNIKWFLVLVFISVTWVNINHERWYSKNVILHDITNYYSYLPACFIEKDMSFSFLKNEKTPNKIYLYTPNKAPNGNFVIKMSMGMAISYLPFFSMAHLFAKMFGYETNGFSEPYHFAILLSSLFYFLIGIYFLFKTLMRHFTKAISLLTLFCICFATNVFYYLTIGAGLAHIVGFTLVTMFIYYSIQWHYQPKIITTVFLGLILGMATLVRPVNVLIALFFLLYDVKSFKDTKLKLKFLFSNLHQLFLIGIVFFLVVSPQLIYWKYITGHYLFNSYVGEHFYFNHPHVFEGLLSFRKGWLIYTPIMLISLIGISNLKSTLPSFYFTTIVFFVMYCYVVFSWWCWWYGGSFGQRALIDIYPVLALPFAAFLTNIKKQRQFVKNVVYSWMVICLLLNWLQTTQAKYNIIHYDSMTKESYFKFFFTMTKTNDREKYLKHPDYEKALRGEDEQE